MTEAVSNFYHWFLVVVFVSVSALAALVLAAALYQFYVAEYREQKDVWLFSLVYIVGAYVAFVLSVGLMATVLSMRRHLVYHSRLLELIARNGAHQQTTDDNLLM